MFASLQSCTVSAGVALSRRGIVNCFAGTLAAIGSFSGLCFAPGTVIVFLLGCFEGPHTDIVFFVFAQAGDGFAGSFVGLDGGCFGLCKAAGSGILDLVTGYRRDFFPGCLEFAGGNCFDTGEFGCFGFAD